MQCFSTLMQISIVSRTSMGTLDNENLQPTFCILSIPKLFQNLVSSFFIRIRLQFYSMTVDVDSNRNDGHSNTPPARSPWKASRQIAMESMTLSLFITLLHEYQKTGEYSILKLDVTASIFQYGDVA